ncbi:general secretion pathway protein GspB [Arenimonas aestuarii]
MSLILEALKKSEAERQRGKAPGLFVQQAVVPARGRRRTPAWAYALGLLLVLVLAVFAWREWSRDAVAPVQTQAPAPEAAAPAPPAGMSQGAPGLDVVPPRVEAPPPRPAPANAPGRPDAAGVPPPARAPAPAVAPPQTPAPVPAPAAAAPVVAPADTLPRLADLPASERNALPSLKITMHVYAEDPAQRFVILDGRRHGEGANPADGVVIQEIRRDGLVLSLRGRDVLLPRP